MNPDEVIREAKGPKTAEQALDETQLHETTNDLIEKVIGRIKDFPRTSHTEEPECVRVLESLKKQPPAGLSHKGDSDSRIGEQIDEYRLVRLIGRGGMGEVYYAEHARLGRGFALKVLHPHRRNDDQLVSRFEREMKAIGQLDHENIVRATGAGRIGDDLFLVMEFVEGEPLSETLKDAPENRLSVDEACRVIREACAGLQYVHDRGIVHRDIKPANLMREKTGRIRILDLGLARITTADKVEDELTREQQTMGTIDFMAPEQIRDSRQVDHRTDIYALGVTFYKLLTGRTPFADELHPTPESRLLAIASEDAPSVNDLRADVPPELADLIRRMVSRDPEGRPQSMSAVAEEVEQIQSASEVDPGLRPAPASAGRKTGIGRKYWIAAALVPFILFAAAQIVIRLQTGDKGELQITAAEDVQVTIRSSDGKEQTLQLTAGQNRPIEVRAGEFEILFAGVNADRFEWNSERTELVMKKGDVFRASIMRRLPDPVAKPEATALAGPSAFDSLRREDIDPYELASAGGGEPAKAPGELVAIYGDSHMMHGGGVFAVKFSPDGRHVASWADESGGRLRIWDAQTGDELHSMPVDSTGAIAFSHDGKLFAVGHSHRGQVSVWRTETWEKIQSLGDEKFPMQVLAFNADGSELAAVGRNGASYVWNLETANLLRSIAGHAEAVQGWSIADDGSQFATKQAGNKVIVTDLISGKEMFSKTTANKSIRAAFGSEGRIFAYADAGGGQIFVCDAVTGEDRRVFKLHHVIGSVSPAFAVSQDGRKLACIYERSGLPQLIALWDVEAGKLLKTMGPSFIRYWSLAFSPDGRTLASAGDDCSVKLWDIETGKLRLPKRERTEAVVSVASNPNGTMLAIGYMDGSIELRDTSSGQVSEVLSNVPGVLRSVAWSPDGKHLAAAGAVMGVAVWKRENWKRPFILSPSAESFSGATFRPDGKTVVAAGESGIEIWDLASGRLRRDLPVEYPGATAPVFSPDGKVLATGDGIGKLCLRNAETGELLRSKQIDGTGQVRVAFSPDGRTIAWPCVNHNSVYDVDTLLDGPSTKIHSSNSPINSAAFSSDGEFLVFTDSWGNLYVLSRNGESTPDSPVQYALWKTIPVQGGGRINQAIITPDGRHVVTANANGTVSVLRLGPPPDHSTK